MFILFAFFLFASGGCSSIERDAREAAELTCESLQLMKKAQSGDMPAVTKGVELMQKAEQMRKELEEKYRAPEDMEKFLTAFNKYLEECKK